MHLQRYVTTMLNVGPEKVGVMKLPAHTPMVIGAVVAVFAPSDVGRPTGASKTKPFPVDGHVPGGPKVLVAEGLSGAVP
jgi:hypothetical protein